MPDSNTIIERYMSQVQRDKDAPIAWEKDNFRYQPIPRKDIASRVNLISRALAGLGVARQDRVMVMLENDLPILIANLAVLSVGGTSTFMPRDFSIADVVKALIESGAKVAFLLDQEQADAVIQQAQKMPDLKAIITPLGGSLETETVRAFSWEQFLEEGRKQPDKQLSLLRAVKPSDTACLIYTKTGYALKGVNRHHDELLKLCENVFKRSSGFKLTEHDIFMVSVPHSHPIGYCIGHILPLCVGGSYLFADPKAPVALADSPVTCIVGTSDYFVTLQNTMIAQAKAAGKMDDFLLKRVLEIGKAKYESKGGLSLIQKGIEASLKATALPKLRQSLCGKLRAVLVVDENMPYDVQLFYFALGIEVIEVGDFT